jgi:hypothetical protein
MLLEYSDKLGTSINGVVSEMVETEDAVEVTEKKTAGERRFGHTIYLELTPGALRGPTSHH